MTIPPDALAQDFVRFALASGVLRFGEFKTKAGRLSPYFFNAGGFDDGAKLGRVGEFYARRLLASGVEFDMLFGPAYKGITLAAAVAVELARLGHNVPFAFNRKEAKDHGEGGVFVGTAPWDGARVVIVDDVITSGKSIHEAADLLRKAAAVTVAGVVVAVDRMERGRGTVSTLQELQSELGAPVRAIVTIREIAAYLHPRVIDDARLRAIEGYLAEHGA
jgi:orotate phosphoribosyltransferase